MEEELLNSITQIGELLLKSGSEIYRVEESLNRMCLTYDFEDISIFALPSYFTLSLRFQDHSVHTVCKRTIQNRINLDSLYSLNDLVRYICENKPSVEVINKKLEDFHSKKEVMPLVFLGYGIGAGFFALFFGGDYLDGLLAMIIGFILYFVIDVAERLQINALVRTLLASQVITLLALSFQQINQSLSSSAIITGCVMLLVPGVAITNSLRDIMTGDNISGQSRMLEALLTATAIALGAGSIMMLLGGM